ncbi:hypothetical protein [Streptomyces sp. NPDC002922]|uniref:hypothetical protein n=1 Tax=Streptomyces sp. NPDC002922 TaxID=3154439 RepID=UPI0033A9EF72
MTVYDWVVSLWRTVVPTIVGFAATTLAHIYIAVDQQALATALMAGFITVYYGLFRFLEARVSRKFGWFLGLAKPPVYPTKPTPVPTPARTSSQQEPHWPRR